MQGGSSEWQKQTSRAYNQKVKMQEKLDLSTHVFGGISDGGQMCRWLKFKWALCRLSCSPACRPRGAKTRTYWLGAARGGRYPPGS